MFHTRRVKTRSARRAGAALSLSALLMFLSLPATHTTSAARAEGRDPNVAAVPPGQAYVQANYVSDSPGLALLEDPLLVNPGGMSMLTSSTLWLANQGTNVSTHYSLSGFAIPTVDRFDTPNISVPGGPPTAMVFNPYFLEFIVTSGSASESASLIFASLNGEISAWSQKVPAPGSSTAFVQVKMPGRRYTGLTFFTIRVPPDLRAILYAADFAGGRIDMFDSSFHVFTFPGIANAFAAHDVPADYHPFGIHSVGRWIYITYAKVGTDGEPVAGAGDGYVRRFYPDSGSMDAGFKIDKGQLNAPWGVEMAPEPFGQFSSRLLVGNYGAGGPSVNAYTPETGAFVGSFKNEAGGDIHIDGLRDLSALSFPDTTFNTLYFTADVGKGAHGLLGSLRPTLATSASLIQFGADEYAISESGSHVDVTVTRAGDVTGAATVNYATFDEPGPGRASQKGDYEMALGALAFAPGETSKTFRVLLVDDNRVEGDEKIGLVLSNPNGAGLGSPSAATITIKDDDAQPPSADSIDLSDVFVRQQYLDFLNREPDPTGFAFWKNEIDSCGQDAQCREVKRIHVSAAFFLSIEFRNTGMLAYLTNKAAFGARVLYGDFEHDTQALQRDFVFGLPGADARLEANKQAYFLEFVGRPSFGQVYANLSPAAFVDSLYSGAGVTPTTAERDAAVGEFGPGANDSSDLGARARVLRRVAENAAFAGKEFNAAFALMEYFGYLRRDPDEAGYQFWLDKLNAAGGDFVKAEMVKAFLNSDEYKRRFTT